MSYTLLDAIEFALEEGLVPQSAARISEFIIEVQLATADEPQVRAAIDDDIARLGPESRFVRTVGGHYALKLWETET